MDFISHDHAHIIISIVSTIKSKHPINANSYTQTHSHPLSYTHTHTPFTGTCFWNTAVPVMLGQL